MLIEVFDLAGMRGQNFSGFLFYFLLLGEIFSYNVLEFRKGFLSVGFEHQTAMILEVFQQEIREFLDDRRFELHGQCGQLVDKSLSRSADLGQIVCISAPQLTNLRAKVNLTNNPHGLAQLLENMALLEMATAPGEWFSTGASKAATLLTSLIVDK